MKGNPFKRIFVGRRKTQRLNELLLSAEKPDHTALKKEADEFIAYIKEKRSVNKV